MRRIKAVPLVVAALAVAAIVAPASASALQWHKWAEPLKESATIKLDGYTGWEAGGSGWECLTHGEATLTAGTSKGEITSFTIDSTKCFIFGVYEPCTITAAPSSAPWVIEAAGANEILIGKKAEFPKPAKYYSYKVTFGGGSCPWKGQTWEVKAEGKLPAITDQAGSAFSNWTFQGKVEIIKPSSVVHSGIVNKFAITPGGTYGLL